MDRLDLMLVVDADELLAAAFQAPDFDGGDLERAVRPFAQGFFGLGALSLSDCRFCAYERRAGT